MSPPARHRDGISILEVIVVVAVLGVLAGLTATLLPRHGMAVSQAERLLASALQFGRFEAIRSNQNVVVTIRDGVVTIGFAGEANLLRTVRLDPQGDRVAIKEPDVEELVFNARGIAVPPMARDVTLGVIGVDRYDLDITISAQGVVARKTGGGS